MFWMDVTRLNGVDCSYFAVFFIHLLSKIARDVMIEEDSDDDMDVSL